jgi:hypothetical protein
MTLRIRRIRTAAAVLALALAGAAGVAVRAFYPSLHTLTLPLPRPLTFSLEESRMPKFPGDYIPGGEFVVSATFTALDPDSRAVSSLQLQNDGAARVWWGYKKSTGDIVTHGFIAPGGFQSISSAGLTPAQVFLKGTAGDKVYWSTIQSF